MSKKMNFILAVPLLLAVAGCGSLKSGTTQTVVIETPGSNASKCILENGNRYNAVAGEPITIMRSGKDLKLECYGSNNRQKNMIVESKFNQWSLGNVVTGVLPGMAYDYASNGMYEYPDVITVNFTDVMAQGHELPQYHDKDVPNPYDLPIESYSATTLKLPEDNTYLKRGIEKRNESAEMNPFDGFYGSNSAPAMTPSNEGATIPSDLGVAAAVSIPAPASSISAKPVLKGSTAEELNRNMNPSVFGQ